MAYMGDGAESVINVIVWPIFIYELLNGNYFQIGALSAVIVVVTVFLQLLVGKWTDKLNKYRILKFSSIFYAVGWIIKMFIFTAFQIFIASTYHGITRLFTRTSFDTIFYEDSADQGHYVDEYTVIHEMAIQYGKVLMMILVLVLLIFMSMQWTFILAATASLFMNFLSYDQKTVKQKNR
jgi:MFS family permease